MWCPFLVIDVVFYLPKCCSHHCLYVYSSVLEGHWLHCTRKPWHSNINLSVYRCTVVVTLTKHRGMEKADDEQLHVLPLYRLDAAPNKDEGETEEDFDQKKLSGSLEILTKWVGTGIDVALPLWHWSRQLFIISYITIEEVLACIADSSRYLKHLNKHSFTTTWYVFSNPAGSFISNQNCLLLQFVLCNTN